MTEIRLSSGHVAVVDEEDADLAVLRWTAVIGSPTRIYASRQKRVGPRREGKRLSIYMHRVIAERLGLVGTDIDHIDGDTLNNRRDNLRAVSRRENTRNVRGPKAGSKSPYMGVTRHNIVGWTARIRIEGRRIYLGWFRTAEEANSARLAAERQHWGIQPRRAEAHSC